MRLLLTVLSALLLSATARADVVVLKNHARYVGKILSQDSATVTISSEGSTWTFKRDKVASITHNAAEAARETRPAHHSAKAAAPEGWMGDLSDEEQSWIGRTRAEIEQKVRLAMVRESKVLVPDHAEDVFEWDRSHKHQVHFRVCKFNKSSGGRDVVVTLAPPEKKSSRHKPVYEPCPPEGQGAHVDASMEIRKWRARARRAAEDHFLELAAKEMNGSGSVRSGEQVYWNQWSNECITYTGKWISTFSQKPTIEIDERTCRRGGGCQCAAMP
jgi:hypothetical protein